jgi:transcriptional regulator with XRE-family HTH domain
MVARTRKPPAAPPRRRNRGPGPTDRGHAALDRHVGALIRAARSRDRLTVTDVANLAGLSVGMLSKIENGQVSPSLDSLNRIANALGLPIGHFFRNFGAHGGSALHVRRGEGMEVVRRGTAKGHTYRLLAYDQGPTKRFEPFLITMDDGSEVFPTFEHPGIEFIYMLEGRLEYRHGDRTYLLEPGDALTFRGEVPHGPERLIRLPIRFLAIIHYTEPVA